VVELGRVVVTRKVASHQVNPLYRCALIHFEPCDFHFRIERQTLEDGSVSVANYMPRNDEVAMLVDAILSAEDRRQAVDLVERLREVFKKHGVNLDYKLEWFV
jgi:hypothetical protein